MYKNLLIKKHYKMAEYYKQADYYNKYISESELEYIKTKSIQSLVGIIAVKKTLKELIQSINGFEVDEKNITITHRLDGLPCVGVSVNTGVDDLNYLVSVSHTKSDITAIVAVSSKCKNENDDDTV